jgi:PPM family protein phosphatase
MAENFFGITDRGKIRDNNEDTFIAEKISGGELIAACVIDGVGGYEGGEVAARIARECITEHLQNPGANITDGLQRAIVTSNEKIYSENQQRKQPEPMACVLTLAVADVEANQFHYAHVGDTRLYLLRDETLVKVTRDHSFVGFLEDSGRLSEEEAMRHPKRNEINKALGFDPQIQVYNDYIETGSSPFLPGDLLLLCSDGLTDMVNAAEITAILTSDSSLEEKGAALVIAANEAGGKDNITVVLVQNNKKPLKQKAAKPVKSRKKKVVVGDETQAPAAVVADAPPRKAPSNSRLAIAILSVACISFLVGFLWQIFKSDDEQLAVKSAVQSDRNQQELMLQGYLDTVTTETAQLNDSLFGKTILLSDSIIIEKDSLELDGGGITLRAGEGYKGPGLVVTQRNRWLILHNIILENFDVGVLLQNKNVWLNNVQFRNCRISFQYQHVVPGENYFNGLMRRDSTQSILIDD